MNRILSLALACAMALSLTACGSKDTGSADSSPATPSGSSQSSASSSAPDTSVPESGSTSAQPVPLPEVLASLALNKTDFTLKAAGATYKLKAEITGTDSALIWTSSDETVATVAEDGTVTAVAPGTAIITATVDEMTADCIVRCSWEEQTETPDNSESSSGSASSIDLNAFVMDLATQYGDSFAANANVVEYGMHADLYPGIDGVSANQLVIYQPMMGAVVCEIALIEVVDSADVETAKAIFQARIDAQVDGGAWYPASIEGWQNNSRIVSNGNYVMMIAWDLCDEAISAFNALF